MPVAQNFATRRAVAQSVATRRSVTEDLAAWPAPSKPEGSVGRHVKQEPKREPS